MSSDAKCVVLLCLSYADLACVMTVSCCLLGMINASTEIVVTRVQTGLNTALFQDIVQ